MFDRDWWDDRTMEEDINPCRGCDDYDTELGCKSNGGCSTVESKSGKQHIKDSTELSGGHLW